MAAPRWRRYGGGGQNQAALGQIGVPIQNGSWTRYKLQRSIFSIGEDFWIEDDRGESVFKVDGKALSLRETFLLEDQSGNELLSVETKLIALQPTMKITRQSQLYATVTKALLTLLHQHYTIQVEGGPAYEAQGDITNHEYGVRINDVPVAQISRQWFSLRDSYGIAVAPDVDHALMLAAAVCIDEISERERDSHH
ncbi:MAG TPA: LURP-one-related family protein [Candidatus Dormibacteraeota bacterium]|nr:LURP-one-related family protein [Candidatus Dormibacteraeota bacterium]